MGILCGSEFSDDKFRSGGGSDPFLVLRDLALPPPLAADLLVFDISHTFSWNHAQMPCFVEIGSHKNHNTTISRTVYLLVSGDYQRMQSLQPYFNLNSHKNVIYRSVMAGAGR